MPGQRKSIEPMAERLRVDSQMLQQFIADSPWAERGVWQAIRREVIPVVEPLQAWVVDETGWLKQGSDSVGVSHRYCGAVGKPANCQVAVELVVSDGEVTAPMGGRLYLPEKWANDRRRREKAGVPAAVSFQTKPQIAADVIMQTADLVDKPRAEWKAFIASAHSTSARCPSGYSPLFTYDNMSKP